MDNKKKIIIISITIIISLILILFILTSALKPRNISQTIDNNISNEEQSNKISLKVKASTKTLKFNISLKNIENIEFNIEKSYNKEFDNPIELENSKNNMQAEDDLTNDIENNVEKCFYRVKAKSLANEDIIFSNVITIKLKNSSFDEDDENNLENNIDIENGDISQWNIEDENEDLYTIDINSSDENETIQNNYISSYEENNEIDNMVTIDTNNEISYEVAYIYLSETEINFDLSGYKEANLVANVGPSTANNKTVTWASSNTQVATVDQNGKVVGKSNGTTTITAKTSNGKFDKCEINVTTSPTSISLDKTSINLDMLNKRQETLVANISPSTASDKILIWTSSDENVAIVNSNGVVTANSNGTAIIKCETPNEKSCTCQVNVTTSGSGIYLNKVSAILDLNDKNQLSLKATVLPSSASKQTLTWSSSNPSIASVDSNGLVTAKGNGTTTIRCTTPDGKSSSCQVSVTTSASKVSLNKTSIELDFKETNQERLTATIIPSNAVNKTITWSSSNPTIAYVDSNGLVIAKAFGATTITARTSNGKIATCKVTVKISDKLGQLIGHMGYSGNGIYGNTQKAFEKAGEIGFIGAEADIRLNNNGVLICLHDKEKNKGTCAVSTYLDICKKYNMIAILDLKSGGSRMISDLCQLVKSKGMEQQVIYQCSNINYLTIVRQYQSNARLWYLAYNTKMSNTELINTAKSLGCEGININKTPSKSLVNDAHKNNIKFCICDLVTPPKSNNSGVDYFMVNRP